MFDLNKSVQPKFARKQKRSSEVNDNKFKNVQYVTGTSRNSSFMIRANRTLKRPACDFVS